MIIPVPVWSPREGVVTFTELRHEKISMSEHFSSAERDERGEPYWLVLSALERIDGAKAREKYYARL